MANRGKIDFDFIQQLLRQRNLVITDEELEELRHQVEALIEQAKSLDAKQKQSWVTKLIPVLRKDHAQTILSIQQNAQTLLKTMNDKLKRLDAYARQCRQALNTLERARVQYERMLQQPLSPTERVHYLDILKTTDQYQRALAATEKFIRKVKTELDKHKHVLTVTLGTVLLIKTAASFTEQVVKEFQVWQTVEQELLPEIVTALEETANALKDVEETSKTLPEQREEYIRRIEEIVANLEQAFGDETLPPTDIRWTYSGEDDSDEEPPNSYKPLPKP